MRAEHLKQKEIDKLTKGSVDEPISSKNPSDSFPTQTETRFARHRERRVPRRAAGFSCFDVGRGWFGDPRVFGRKDWGATSRGTWLRMGGGLLCGNSGGGRRVGGDACRTMRVKS